MTFTKFEDFVKFKERGDKDQTIVDLSLKIFGDDLDASHTEKCWWHDYVFSLGYISGINPYLIKRTLNFDTTVVP